MFLKNASFLLNSPKKSSPVSFTRVENEVAFFLSLLRLSKGRKSPLPTRQNFLRRRSGPISVKREKDCFVSMHTGILRKKTQKREKSKKSVHKCKKEYCSTVERLKMAVNFLNIPAYFWITRPLYLRLKQAGQRLLHGVIDENDDQILGITSFRKCIKNKLKLRKWSWLTIIKKLKLVKCNNIFMSFDKRLIWAAGHWRNTHLFSSSLLCLFFRALLWRQMMCGHRRRSRFFFLKRRFFPRS